jgi:hypothetical protein
MSRWYTRSNMSDDSRVNTELVAQCKNALMSIATMSRQVHWEQSSSI